MDASKIRIAGPEALHHAQAIHDAYYVDSGKYKPVFSEYVAASIETFANEWDGDVDCVWLAEAGGQLVGYVATRHTESDMMQLRYLYVDPVARGHGLGRQLVRFVIDHARAVGASGVMLWTMEDQEKAANLYKSLGWKLVETAPAPWHDELQQQRYDLRF